jgi:hypothetical protein
MCVWRDADADPALLPLLRCVVALAGAFGLEALGGRLGGVVAAVGEMFDRTRAVVIGEAAVAGDLVQPISELYVLIGRADAESAASLRPLLCDCLASGTPQTRAFAMSVAVRLIPAGVLADAGAIVDAIVAFVRDEPVALATDAVVAVGRLAQDGADAVFARVAAVLDAIEGRVARFDRASLAVFEFQDAAGFAVTQLVAAMGDHAPFERGFRLLTQCLPPHGDEFFDDIFRPLAGIWRLFVVDESASREFVRIAVPMMAMAATRLDGGGAPAMTCAYGIRTALRMLPNAMQAIEDALGQDEFRRRCFEMRYERALQEYEELMEITRFPQEGVVTQLE